MVIWPVGDEENVDDWPQTNFQPEVVLEQMRVNEEQGRQEAIINQQPVGGGGGVLIAPKPPPAVTGTGISTSGGMVTPNTPPPAVTGIDRTRSVDRAAKEAGLGGVEAQPGLASLSTQVRYIFILLFLMVMLMQQRY